MLERAASLWRRNIQYVGKHRWVVGTIGLLGALSLWAIWHWRGPIVSSLSDVSNLILVLGGLWFAMSPGKTVELEGNKKTRRILGASLICVGVVGLVSGYYDKKSTRQALQQLVAASADQATKKDIQGLRGDVVDMRRDMKTGFDSVVSAINALGDRLVGKSFKPAPKPQITTPEREQPAPVREHIIHTERSVPAPAGGPSYATQVVIQTDSSSQPTRIRIEADRPIDKGNFFIVGQPVMMNVRTIVQGNAFIFSFGYPAFTAETPIVVTLLSNNPIAVKSVKRVSPIG
jgi:hypothetical protein